MKTGKIFAAFVAAFPLLLAAGCNSTRQEASLGSNAQGLALQPISGGHFAVASVVETPGSSTIHLYGGSNRGGLPRWEFGVLTTTDGFATAPTWQALNGIVGYGASQDNSAIVTCPSGQACGGYKAFYVIANPGRLYRCTGLSGVANLSGCALWSMPGMNFDSLGIGLDQSGDKILVGAQKTGDTRGQVYLIDIATSLATKLTACSDPSNHTGITGGVVGEGANRYLYVWYNAAHYRYAWNGTTCTGSRLKVGAAMGWDNGVDDPANDDNYGAVGKTTGTFYFSRAEGDLYLSQKDRSCNNDSFISGGEVCDPSSSTPLNGQSCTTIGAGFSSGSLACNPATCEWNTSACVMPTNCGNNVKDATEQCDGTDLGSGTCSLFGTGWTGAPTCKVGCDGFDVGTCVPPTPICGNGICDGTDNCTTCPADCTCPGNCGNGSINPGEQCDGANLNSKTCATENGVGWSGDLTCNSSCSFNKEACRFEAIKVLSGGCKVAGEDSGTITTAPGKCQLSFTRKGGTVVTSVEIEASDERIIPFENMASPLPERTVQRIPKGILWTEKATNGNRELYRFGTGAGIVMGNEGTGHVIDTRNPAFDSVTMLDGKDCFGTQGNYESRWSAINVGNGEGCITQGWRVDFDSDSVRLISITPPNGGDAGADGSVDGGITPPPTDGSAGSDTGSNPPGGGGGDGGGCSCAVPAKNSFGGYTLIVLLSSLVILVRRRRN